MWGGRFGAPSDPRIRVFTRSFPFDRRLVRWDLVGSLAHARMLLEVGVLDRESGEVILQGLAGMLRDVEAGALRVEGEDEDVHTWIERVLTERIGEPARRLHTARSRNDQVATALRLYVREAAEQVVEALLELVAVWLEQAREHRETVLPGYTHLQRAQPTSLAHHLLAHVWPLLQDADRFRRVHRVSGICPLGAGALATSPYPIRPERTAELLGFEEIYLNSMHAVGDRDYVLETLFACAVLQSHLSRWAEEVVLWTTQEFGFASLDDSVAGGSSLMPQKKNPEAAELIRGKAGRTIGALTTVLAALKGLPLTYNSDLQEDKEPLFDALDTVRGSLQAATALARGLRYRPDRMRSALRRGFLTATDLADYLVRRGVPFRTAHEQAGRAVREAEARGCELWELPLEVLQACCPEVEEDVYGILSPEGSVHARAVAGGPAPPRVAEQLERAQEAVEEVRRWRRACKPPPIYTAYREGRLLGERL
ncbi:MAG: argininosuccinate lyase [Armatimonadetes bacterium]|nr:argininosuccinate lyase [Armatimonadota bacterium]MDW8154197.1 argininosuccinate lyase [Armatimonadota bacterium]